MPNYYQNSSELDRDFSKLMCPLDDFFTETNINRVEFDKKLLGAKGKVDFHKSPYIKPWDKTMIKLISLSILVKCFSSKDKEDSDCDNLIDN